MPSLRSCSSYRSCCVYMIFLNTTFSRRPEGTFSSSGRGSAVKRWPSVSPAAISWSYRSYTGFITSRPKLITVWPYWLVTGTIRSAPKASPYMTRVLTTLAMTSPFSPSSSACCWGVRIMGSLPFCLIASLYQSPQGLSTKQKHHKVVLLLYYSTLSGSLGTISAQMM